MGRCGEVRQVRDVKRSLGCQRSRSARDSGEPRSVFQVVPNTLREALNRVAAF